MPAALRRRALLGAPLGGTDPLAPIPRFAPQIRNCRFGISVLAGPGAGSGRAKPAGQAVLVDFSADWCVSCKEMERYTFSDPKVQAALHHVVLLRADVTRE